MILRFERTLNKFLKFLLTILPAQNCATGFFGAKLQRCYLASVFAILLLILLIMLSKLLLLFTM